MIGDIAVNILASIIIFVCGYIFKSIIELYKLRPLHMFWKKFTKDSEQVYLIFSTTPTFNKDIKEYQKNTVAIAAVLGMAELIGMFKTNFKQVPIIPYPESEFSSRNVGHNLICMGGPPTNRISHLINEKLHEIVHMKDNHLAIKNGDLYSSVIINDSIKEDFGFILVTKNPFSAKHYVCWFAGIFAYGTQAAIKACTLRYISETFTHIRKIDSFLVIVKCSVVDDFASEPEIVKVYNFLEFSDKVDEDIETSV